MNIQNTYLQPFFGVVEDRMDPKKLGRVRVRIYGDHPFSKTKGDVAGLETEDLLWFQVLLPATSATESGVGNSPTGILEGSSVFGLYLDKYKTSGIVLGTWAGIRTEMPNYTEGFSDPNQQYPTKLGNDLNDLSLGGRIGRESIVNIIQNDNRETAPNPSNIPAGEEPENNSPELTIEKMLQRDEGLRLRWYPDNGYASIGIGHLIKAQKTSDPDLINKWISELVGRKVTNGTITMDECMAIFKSDIKKVKDGIVKHPTIGPIYKKCNASRKMALENMAYQMGLGGLAKFKKTLKYMEEEKWEDAYINLQQSLWFRQTKGRASRVSLIIRNGNLESYGEKTPSNARALSSQRNINIEPEDPYVPNDTRVMFEEPKTEYNSQYPYNKTFGTESGMIQEFDDTPGAERYRLTHTSGTYQEISPDGRNVQKIIGDNYKIVQQDDHILVQGDVKLVIGGNSNVYIMGTLNQTIDGSVNQTVRGNVVQHVEGNVKATIDQTADILVKEEAMVTVEKDVTVNANQNAEINVKEQATVNAENISVNAEKKMEFKAEDVDFSAVKTFSVDSGVLTKITGANVQVG